MPTVVGVHSRLIEFGIKSVDAANMFVGGFFLPIDILCTVWYNIYITKEVKERVQDEKD